MWTFLALFLVAPNLALLMISSVLFADNPTVSGYLTLGQILLVAVQFFAIYKTWKEGF